VALRSHVVIGANIVRHSAHHSKRGLDLTSD
jgi:hypothetical protein